MTPDPPQEEDIRVIEASQKSQGDSAKTWNDSQLRYPANHGGPPGKGRKHIDKVLQSSQPMGGDPVATPLCDLSDHLMKSRPQVLTPHLLTGNSGWGDATGPKSPCKVMTKPLVTFPGVRQLW